MTTEQFNALAKGDRVQVVDLGYYGPVCEVRRRTSYGYQVVCLETGRLTKLINPARWERCPE